MALFAVHVHLPDVYVNLLDLCQVFQYSVSINSTKSTFLINKLMHDVNYNHINNVCTPMKYAYLNINVIEV